jgi:hypothetical protein
MKRSMIWKKLDSDLITGEGLFVGQWRVAILTYRDHAADDDRKKYLVNNSLAGLPSHLGEFETVEEAKHCAEQYTKMWFTGVYSDTPIEIINKDQNESTTRSKRKLAEMSLLDRRFFMFGACLVATVLCLFNPEHTAKALKKLMSERT